MRALSSLRLALALLSPLIISRSFALVQLPGTGEAFTCKRIKPRASRLSFVMTHSSGEGSHHISDVIRSLKCVRLDQEETFDTRYLKTKRGAKEDSHHMQMMLLNRVFDADAAAFPRSEVLFSHPAFEWSQNASDHIAMAASKRWDWGQYGRPPKKMTWSDWADRVEGSFAACACEIRGALVRLPAHAVCQLQVTPVVLARTDLLRYSLSNCTVTSTPFLTPRSACTAVFLARPILPGLRGGGALLREGLWGRVGNRWNSTGRYGHRALCGTHTWPGTKCP